MPLSSKFHAVLRAPVVLGFCLMVGLWAWPTTASAEIVRYLVRNSMEQQLDSTASVAREQLQALYRAHFVDSLAGALQLHADERAVGCFFSTSAGGDPLLFDLRSGAILRHVGGQRRIVVFWLDDAPACEHSIAVKIDHKNFRRGFLEDLRALHGAVGKFAQPVRGDEESARWSLHAQVFDVAHLPSDVSVTFKRGPRPNPTGGALQETASGAAAGGASSWTVRFMDWDREWFGLGVTVGTQSVNRRIVDIDPSDANYVIVRRNVLAGWEGGGFVTAYFHMLRDRGWNPSIALWRHENREEFLRRFTIQTGVALSNRPFDQVMLVGGLTLTSSFDLVGGGTWTRTDAPSDPVRIRLSAISGFGDLDAQLPRHYSPQWFCGVTVHGRSFGAALSRN